MCVCRELFHNPTVKLYTYVCVGGVSVVNSVRCVGDACVYLHLPRRTHWEILLSLCCCHMYGPCLRDFLWPCFISSRNCQYPFPEICLSFLFLLTKSSTIHMPFSDVK